MSEILIKHEFLFKWNDVERLINVDNTLKCILEIFKLCTCEINKNVVEVVQDTVDNLIFMSDSIAERQWEVLNTGSWSCVELNEKQIYGLAIYFKVTLSLLKKLNHTVHELQSLLSDLDHAIIKGAYLNHNESNILRLMAEQLNRQLYQMMNREELKSLDLIRINDSLIPEPPFCQYKLDILEKPPSIEKFMRHYFHPQKPCIIQNYITQNWEACDKWKDIDYLIKVCGHRLVPVEIGSSYADENWKQKLILFKDFLKEIVVDKPSEQGNDIKYLAQHNLFEQITELQNDFTIPEYCYITNSDDIDIKSWFGPKNTKTPLHYDNKQNLLCQVFGYKRVILISPADTKFIDCYDSMLLNNTCTIDFDNVNYLELNPNLGNCKICEFILKPGDMLFIPYKWWHYVKSLSTSFSVSFWWE